MVERLGSVLVKPESVNTRRVQYVAIHGLGGIGKSSLARELCHTPSVRERFDGGILWVSFGTSPNTLGNLTACLAAFDDNSSRPATVAEATERLRGHVVGLQVLIVLDDVWNEADAAPFLVIESGAIVVTTRRSPVADALGARLVELPFMTSEESIALFERWLERSISEAERGAADSLATALGHLPLALQLAAAQVARGRAWGDVQQLFVAELHKLRRSLPSVTPQRAAIFACINVSLQSLRAVDDALWRRCLALGVLADNVSLTADLAAILWGTQESEASTSLSVLVDEALIHQRDDSFSVHNFVHELLSSNISAGPPDGLGLPHPIAHARALTSFGWRGVNDCDLNCNYARSNVLWHLIQAGMANDAHALLAQSDAVGRNYWQGILTRHSQAGELAHHFSVVQKLSNESPVSCSRQTRYALVDSTFRSHVVSETVVTSLVKNGYWEPPEALAAVGKLPSGARRTAYTSLVGAFRCRGFESHAHNTALRVLDEINFLYDSGDKFAAALSLLPEVTGEQARSLVAILSDAVRDARLVHLISAISVLPGPMLPQVMSTVAVRIGSDERAALETARSIGGMLPRIEMETRSVVIDLMCDMARSLRDRGTVDTGGYRSMIEQVITWVGSAASDAVRSATRASGLESDLDRYVTAWRDGSMGQLLLERLSKLTDDALLNGLCEYRHYLPSERLAEVGELALRAILETYGVRNFASLRWALGEAQVRKVISQVVDELGQGRRWDVDGDAAALLRDCSEAESGVLLDFVMSNFRRLSVGAQRDRAFVRVIENAPRDSVLALLKEYRTIGDSEESYVLRFTLAPFLGSEYAEQIAQEAQGDERRRVFAKVLRELVDVLSADQLSGIVDAACQMVGEWWIVEELTSLLRRVDDVEKIARVLSSSQALAKSDLRSRLASRVVLRLVENGHDAAALSAGRQIDLRMDRAKGLADGAIRTAECGRFESAMLLAQEIIDTQERGRAEAYIALLLGQSGRSDDARALIGEISWPPWREWAHDRIGSSNSTVGVTTAVAPANHSNGVETGTYLAPIRLRAEGSKEWAKLLAVIEEAPRGGLPGVLSDFWGCSLRESGETFVELLGHGTRRDVIWAMRDIIPLLGHVGDMEELRRIDCAVRDVFRWWP